MTEQHAGNPSEALEPFEDFVRRHVGPSPEEQEGMLKVLGYDTLDALVDAAVPGSVRSLGTLQLPPPVSEHQVLEELRRLAAGNTIAEPMIGLGYSGTITPGSSGATCSRARLGTRRTPRTSPKSVRVVWRRSSTSRRW